MQAYYRYPACSYRKKEREREGQNIIFKKKEILRLFAKPELHLFAITKRRINS